MHSIVFIKLKLILGIKEHRLSTRINDLTLILSSERVVVNNTSRLNPACCTKQSDEFLRRILTLIVDKEQNVNEVANTSKILL